MIFNYIRVSTDHQTMDRQLAGIECDREYIETASAKDANRPQLQAMLSNLRSGDVVNVHELSRLARNTKDLLDIVEQAIAGGATIIFHKEGLRFASGEKSDPFQRLMLSMLGAISTFERDLMLERQREGIAIAKRKGKYKGRVSKFSDEQVQEIMAKYSDPMVNKSALAREYGITRQHLYGMARKSSGAS